MAIELRNLHIALCKAKVEADQLRSSKATDEQRRQRSDEEKERYAMHSEELYRSLCDSREHITLSVHALSVSKAEDQLSALAATKDRRIAELETLLATALEKEKNVSADQLAALSTNDSRIEELEKRLSVATVKSAAAVMAATTAAQHEASLALSLALATAQQEADTVIAQLQQDMRVLQGCVEERDSTIVTAQQEADGLIDQLQRDIIVLQGHVDERDDVIIRLDHDMCVLQGCVEDRDSTIVTAQQESDGLIDQLQRDVIVLQGRVDEREDVIIRLDHDMSVLQGCVDERNSSLVTAHQEADLCILQMDDQLRLAKADLVALLQQQQEQHQQQEEQQQEQEQLLVNELKHRIQTQSEEHVEQLRRVRDMVCSEREEQRVVQEHNDEDKERYAMYAEDLYRSLSREMEAHRLVREDTKVGIWRLHIHPHPHPLSSD